MIFADKIENWKVENKGFGLILPNGWFGKPYDNVHSITWIADRKYKLLIEIDEQLLLIITKTKQFQIEKENKDLVFKNYLRIVFDRLGYGDLKAHSEIFESGELRFVSYQLNK